MPKPIAFLSYASADDEDGKISEIRGQLDTAYWAHADSTSRESIFQDSIQISWEQDWRTRLSQALDQSVFLIPIVTPSFFASPHCKDALRSFAARELTLGHKDLILPIYYSDVPDFESSSDPLVRLVASRRILDWRQLRLSGFSADAERAALKSLVLAVRDAAATHYAVPKAAGSGPFAVGSAPTPTGLKPFLSRPPRPTPESTPPSAGESFSDSAPSFRPPAAPAPSFPSQPPAPAIPSQPPMPSLPMATAPEGGGARPAADSTRYLMAMGGLLLLVGILGTALFMTFALRGGNATAKMEPADAGAPSPSVAQASPRLLFRLAGSDTIGDRLAGTLAQGFMKEQLGLTTVTISPDSTNEHLLRVVGTRSPSEAGSLIEIVSHHSIDAITGLQGDADIGMMSRSMTEKEKDEFRQRSVSVTEHILGLDGIAVVVNPNVSLTGADGLTVDQLRGLFNGTITKWSDVGGPAVDVVPYVRGIGSGTREVFEANIMKGAEFSKSAKVADRNGMVSGVLQSIGGIGFVTWTDAAATKVVAISRAAGAEALKPSFETIDREDYVLTRRLYLYFRPHADADRTRQASQFITYALSDHGQDEVEKAHFVRLDRYEVTSVPDDARDPADYRQAVHGAQRVSLNFHFAEGKAELDSRAESDVRRLTEFMHHDATLARRSLLLIGLASSSGAASANEDLSNRRATNLANAFKQEGLASVEVKRFGSRVLSASVDPTDSGRRVEVWLR